MLHSGLIDSDQCQSLGNCAPTPPLNQQVVIINTFVSMLG